MDILLTGGTGQVGIELLRCRWPDGVRIHAPDRKALNLADPNLIERAFETRRWGAVISCGAYTAVDKAETEVREAWQVNALAPALLAQHSARAGIPIIHVSTDYVFDGRKDGYYEEEDPVGPINVYGASKEGGEQAVRTANPHHAVVRTGWVVSSHGRNFLTTILRLAREQDVIPVVSDQRGCPTFAADLAEALATVATRLADNRALSGTYHFVNAGEASRSEFARAILVAAAARTRESVEITDKASSYQPDVARRPSDTRLSTKKFEKQFRLNPRPWRASLKHVFSEQELHVR